MLGQFRTFYTYDLGDIYTLVVYKAIDAPAVLYTLHFYVHHYCVLH